MKVLVVIALCIVAASAGVVDHTSCGGAGEVVQLRIEGCEGAVAEMRSGRQYPSEADIVPAAAAPELRLKISTVFMGAPVTIIDTVLPNSSVSPGTQYTIRWSITPSTLLVGLTVPVNAEVINEANQIVLLCGRVMVSVSE